MPFYWWFGAHWLAGVAFRAHGTSSTDPKLLTRVGRKKAALSRGLFGGNTGMKQAWGRMETLQGGEKGCDTTRTGVDQPKRHVTSPASRNQRHRPGWQQLSHVDEPTGAAGGRHLPKKAAHGRMVGVWLLLLERLGSHVESFTFQGLYLPLSHA